MIPAGPQSFDKLRGAARVMDVVDAAPPEPGFNSSFFYKHGASSGAWIAFRRVCSSLCSSRLRGLIGLPSNSIEQSATGGSQNSL